MYLYRDGNEIISVIGGWSADGYTGYSYDTQIPVNQGIKNIDNLSLSTTSTTNGYVMFGTQNLIPVSKYSKLCIDLNCSIYNGSYVSLYSRCNTIKVLNGGSRTNLYYYEYGDTLPVSVFDRRMIVIDISTWTTDVYLNFNMSGTFIQTYNIVR